MNPKETQDIAVAESNIKSNWKAYLGALIVIVVFCVGYSCGVHHATSNPTTSVKGN